MFLVVFQESAGGQFASKFTDEEEMRSFVNTLLKDLDETDIIIIEGDNLTVSDITKTYDFRLIPIPDEDLAPPENDEENIVEIIPDEQTTVPGIK